LLFTNDGTFAAKVMHPSSEIKKTYFVQTDKKIPFEFIDAFVHGINDNGEILKALSVHYVTTNSVEITLHEGKNREIRRALAQFGLHARILQRIALGPITIKDLPEGSWRKLTQDEISILQKGGH
ncbi:MAG TPA: rRNA pseudouridine synthase, partial [Spirochaetales bacterium]|nr:rRNA pseudouridine synthase [Spirochaetales bacterium]